MLVVCDCLRAVGLLGEVSAYDPLMRAIEINVRKHSIFLSRFGSLCLTSLQIFFQALNGLGIATPVENLEGRHKTRDNQNVTLFFLPHCASTLTANVLW